ncbi:ATP-binding protein [Rhodococcus sp. SGAir0479]|uniref:ATP-binding protein n=1 Tax=Rhodococcus sp. SGAir0479 TaxID=2567884 RepID=UPI0010CD5F9E|nr:ATP-binding protein [Rhodococcus sp. SGAir0479]QCQ91359.1 ATP-binding protein [Rhodococcus sp. SGAir0479]
MSELFASTRRPEDSGPVIELRTPAEASQLAPIRSVSASLAEQCDMTLDQIADLRLAVDEACSTLFRIALRDSDIVCRFRVSPRMFHFSGCVATTGEDADGPYERRFGWHVLRTLTDDLKLHRHHGNGDGRLSTVTISFAVRCGDVT